MRLFTQGVRAIALLVRDEDVEARAWLDREGYPELPHFWDALENVERSFKWLMETVFRNSP